MDDFLYTCLKFKTLIPIIKQSKQSPLSPDSLDISNPNIEAIHKSPINFLILENNFKHETTKIVTINVLD